MRDVAVTGVQTCALPINPYEHFFFFQAEDGIRDVAVTGVQTCALPISGLGFDRTAPPNTLTVNTGTFDSEGTLSWSAPTFINPTTAPSTLNDKEWIGVRSEEHTSELQSRLHLVCRLLLEKKKDKPTHNA